MFKLTQADLAAKSTSQLAALFNTVDLEIAGMRATSPDRDRAIAARTLILAELARRGPAP